MCIFIYSGSARLTSFEINFISKETSRAEPEYMNIHPPPISALATALPVTLPQTMPEFNDDKEKKEYEKQIKEDKRCISRGYNRILEM